MMIDGKHYNNVTCGRCRFRHPPQFTCEQARKAAEANRALQLKDADAEAQPRAYEACDEFDAAVFSGDEFIDEGGLALLDEYLNRWRRAWRERRPDLDQYSISPDLQHRRLGTLAALLRSGKIIRGGLTPQEMADWAKQVDNIMSAPKAAPTEEKDPLLL